MRRCQRLPEVTHPVDSTRPVLDIIKSHARPPTAEASIKRCIFDSAASCAGDTAVLILKQTGDDFLNRAGVSTAEIRVLQLIDFTSAITVFGCNACVLF